MLTTANSLQATHLASLPTMVFGGLKGSVRSFPIMVRPYDGQHMPHAKPALNLCHSHMLWCQNIFPCVLLSTPCRQASVAQGSEACGQGV
jgi:hypothetical protein